MHMHNHSRAIIALQPKRISCPITDPLDSSHAGMCSIVALGIISTESLPPMQAMKRPASQGPGKKTEWEVERLEGKPGEKDKVKKPGEKESSDEWMSLCSTSQLREHERRHPSRPTPSTLASNSQPSTSHRSRSRSRSPERRGGLFAFWVKSSIARDRINQAQRKAFANRAAPITQSLVDACGQAMEVGVLDEGIMVGLKITMSLLSRWGGDLCFWVQGQPIRIGIPTNRHSQGNHTLPTGNHILPTEVILPPGLGCHITFAIFGDRRLDVHPQETTIRIKMPSKPFNKDNEGDPENFDEWLDLATNRGLARVAGQPQKDLIPKYYCLGFVPFLFVGMMAITKEERDELRPRLLIRGSPPSGQFPRRVTWKTSPLGRRRVWCEALEFVL